MNTNVVSLRAGPPDALAELFAERERLGAELARFVIFDDRLNALEAKLADVTAAQAAINRADREAVETWAATGEGEPPPALLAERKALLARRLDAEAEREAAAVAVDAVSGKRVALIHAINAVGVRIKDRQVAAATDQARALHGEVEKFAGEIGQRMMRIEALRQVLTDSLSEAGNRRDDAQAAPFRTALGEVEKLRAPQVLGDPATVARFAADWRGRLR